MAADTRDSRFDRHRMRQRGAGARDIKTQFGFSLALPTEHASAERSGRGGSALSPPPESLQCRDAVQKPMRKRKRVPDCAVAPLSEVVNDSIVPKPRRGRQPKSKTVPRITVNGDDDENYNPAELAIQDPKPKRGRVGRPAKSKAATKISKGQDGETPGKLHTETASHKDLDATEQMREVDTETDALEPKPRRRGRPPKNATCTIDIVEAAVEPKPVRKTTKKKKATTNAKTTMAVMRNGATAKESSEAKDQPPPSKSPQASNNDSSQIPFQQPTREVDTLEVTQEREVQRTTAHDNGKHLKPQKTNKAPSKSQALTISPKPAKPETSQPPTASISTSTSNSTFTHNPPPPPQSQEKAQHTSKTAQESHQRSHHKPSQSHQRTTRPRAKPNPAIADNEANDWAREDWFEASVPASLLRIAEATNGSAAGKAARLKFRF